MKFIWMIVLLIVAMVAPAMATDLTINIPDGQNQVQTNVEWVVGSPLPTTCDVVGTCQPVQNNIVPACNQATCNQAPDKAVKAPIKVAKKAVKLGRNAVLKVGRVVGAVGRGVVKVLPGRRCHCK